MSKANGSGTIYLRGQTWWVQVYVDGKPHVVSSKSKDKAEAKRLRDQLLAKKIRGEVGGNPEKVLVTELLDDLLAADVAESTRDNRRQVVEKNVRPFFGPIRAARLTTDLFNQYRAKRRLEVSNTGKPISDATVNRELSLVRVAMNLGRKHTPPKVHTVPYFPILKEETVRQGFLHDDLYPALRDALDDAVRPLFVCAYFTGTRKGELLKAQWDWVDFERNRIYVPPAAAKNRTGRILPIPEGDMRDLLLKAKQKRDLEYPECEWVFSRDGELIKDYRAAWHKARKIAGAPKLLFHDLRRTAVRNMRRLGIPQAMRMKISGHKTDSMERRYNITDDDDIEMAMAKMGN